jgi:hypothetical protein
LAASCQEPGEHGEAGPRSPGQRAVAAASVEDSERCSGGLILGEDGVLEVLSPAAEIGELGRGVLASCPAIEGGDDEGERLGVVGVVVGDDGSDLLEGGGCEVGEGVPQQDGEGCSTICRVPGLGRREPCLSVEASGVAEVPGEVV